MRQTFIKIVGIAGLYDLGSGYLTEERIGNYDGVIPIYSSEKYLLDVEELVIAIGKRIVTESVTVEDSKIWRREDL